MSIDRLTIEQFLALASQYENASEFKARDPSTYARGRDRGWLRRVYYRGSPTILLPGGARIPIKKKNFIFHVEDFL